MARPSPKTLGEKLYFSYAQLAMMHSTLTEGLSRPGKTQFMIRGKLYSGLCKGRMDLRDFCDDERLKIDRPQVCWYCGSTSSLSVDHIIPRHKGGASGGENLIPACRTCNSSKGSSDLLEWLARKGQFPSLLLLRRYLKMAILFCREKGLMDLPLDEAEKVIASLPFSLDAIPTALPPAEQLKMDTGTSQE
jgi:5-methylcytosine-specific restriction endonuclease McrA